MIKYPNFEAQPHGVCQLYAPSSLLLFGLAQLHTKLAKLSLCPLLHILLEAMPILVLVLYLNACQVSGLPVEAYQSTD